MRALEELPDNRARQCSPIGGVARVKKRQHARRQSERQRDATTDGIPRLSPKPRNTNPRLASAFDGRDQPLTYCDPNESDHQRRHRIGRNSATD